MSPFENPFNKKVAAPEIPRGHEAEVGLVKTAIEEVVGITFGGAKYTAERLHEDWLRLKKTIEGAGRALKSLLEEIGFSENPAVIEYIKSTLDPLERIIFAMATQPGVIVKEEEELLKVVHAYEKGEEKRGKK